MKLASLLLMLMGIVQLITFAAAGRWQLVFGASMVALAGFIVYLRSSVRGRT